MTQRTRSANLGGTVITSTGVVLASGLDVSNQSNAAYAQANTARNTANNAFDRANGAFNQANAVFDQANAAYLQANTARSDSNTTFATVNSTFGTVNTAVTNAHNQANSAFNAANGKLSLTGGSIVGDITITGNLFVNGTETIVNTASLTINDPIFLLANNNTTNAVGLGFTAHYGPTQQHTGLIRAHQDNNWYLFEGYDEHILYANNVLDLSQVKLATLRANVNANSLLLVGNTVATQANLTLAYDQANSAFTAANNRVLKSGDTMTGNLIISAAAGAASGTFAGGVSLFRVQGSTSAFSEPRIDLGEQSLSPTAYIAAKNEGNGGGSLIFGNRDTSSSTSALTERMRITPTGNVGIGTTSPVNRLTINGTNASDDVGMFQVLYSGTGTLNSSITAKNYYGTSQFMQWETYGLRIGNRIVTNGGAGSVIITAGNDAEAMRILSSGNVGIGIASPGQKLDVSGSIRASSQLISTVATGTAPLSVSSTTAVTNLNADMVDGIHSTGFYRTGVENSPLIIRDNRSTSNYYTEVGLEIRASNQKAIIGLHRDGFSHCGISHEASNQLRFNFNSGDVYLNHNTGTIWGSGNDGSGSGLDADVLDGIQGSSFLRSDQSATNSVDLRAPNFYISADTSNRFGQGVLTLRNSSPTMYFQDTDNNSAMLHCNSNLLYVLRGGNDTISWSAVNGQWPFIFNLSNNDATCGAAIYAVGNITAYSSDRRLKTNIQKIPNALDKVLSLNGVTFDWIDRVKELGFIPDTMVDDSGLIAQEVQAVLPQAVKPAPFDREWDKDKNEYVSRSGEDFITVQYEKLVPLLIEAIKELKAEIDELKKNN